MFGYNFITNRIAVGGSIESEGMANELLLRGITHVLNVSEFADPAFASAIFKTCFNPTLDDGTFKPASWFADSLAFILPDVTDPKLRFYVHCVAGINRSASTVYAVLRALGLNPMAARLIIELNRPLDFVGLRYAGDADVALKKLHYVD